MTTTTLLLIFLSIVIAGGLSFFQYFFRNKNRTKVTFWLAFLRFLSVLGLLLLLINPRISNKSFQIQKTPLAILIDNSSSIKEMKANEEVIALVEKLKQNEKLQERFDIQTYTFGNEFKLTEKPNFTESQTNIDQAAKRIKNLHKNKKFPTVLISDGNQTTGNDYLYSFDENNKVFSVVAGDTTTVLDLKISQLNVNKYAFHKNKFPVEVFLDYSGNKNVNATFTISQGNSVLAKQNISFSGSKKSAVVNVLLPAERTGVQILKATISSSEIEKNTYNNSKNFAVEVIDQKSEIGIVSSLNHPDIGTLKRAIETNAQRKVTLINPNNVNDLQNFNVLIFYQPNSDFKNVFTFAKNTNRNFWIITGTNTDFNFLNQQQSILQFKMSGQKEDYLADFQSQFGLFAVDNVGFENFPPLQNSFGSVTTTQNVNILLSSRIRNVNTGYPLLCFSENAGSRTAFLLGENIWKWRMQTYLNHQSYEKFDVFADKIIQFLASNNAKKNLVVTHESFYNSGDDLEITAQFFNKNYEFDENAQLSISVVNRKTKHSKLYNLVRSGANYKVNLNGLTAGEYDFKITENRSKQSYSNFFEILDFDIEKQFVNPNATRLQQLATQTQGEFFLVNQVEPLIKKLLEQEQYKDIQKEIFKKTPLIDWIWLLVFIAVLLAAEWFVRKYHGML
ncbi:hypothetical protein GV828_08220 [Flavobacterium sp. NST-5]|uniref:VWFA domain-containing protein n=1 Tax=Flavobacterium ichthyis TaxID=2698827 RepID=A0ABW9Z8G0_9FLAO|nr:hypothetical protein [Flavobacterium ichthyis]NBL65181.1 hypothetical protein [Flavobacterium ichthyis]